MKRYKLNGKLNISLYLKEDNGLAESDIQRLKSIVSWNDFTPDSLSESRHAIQKLSRPIEIKRNNSMDGIEDIVFKSLKIKGIHHKEATLEIREARWKGKEDPTDTKMPDKSFMQDHNGTGSCLITTKYEENGAKPDKFFSEGSVPVGVCLFDKAITEYSITNQMFEAGLNVCLPVGYGRFDDLRYKNKETGFVVMAITNERDMRFCDQINMLKNRNADFFNVIFRNLGRQHRALMQKGFTTLSMHEEDISLDENHGFKRVIFHDNNRDLNLANMTLKQFFGYVVEEGVTEAFHNAKSIDHNFTEEKSIDCVTAGGYAMQYAEKLAYEILKNKNAQPLLNFLKGFFYDEKGLEGMEKLDFLTATNMVVNANYGLVRLAPYDIMDEGFLKKLIRFKHLEDCFHQLLVRDHGVLPGDTGIDKRLEMLAEYEEKYGTPPFSHGNPEIKIAAIPYLIKIKKTFDKDHNKYFSGKLKKPLNIS